MAWQRGKNRNPAERAAGPALVVQDLDVYYGQAHALQGVSFTLERGVLGIVGRNGMGKTTLCNAIAGLVAATGSVRVDGTELRGLEPHAITRHGIAYVPQGRRVWPSLTVDETLRLVARDRREVDRVYAMFPRLAERKGNGGSQLSGGEQQMLAIGRALLLQPRVLVMDEPTEGLAPVIVEQVAQSLRELGASEDIAILLIEQNLGVAIDVSDQIGIMVNGRIEHLMPAQELAANRDLQERLLGARSLGEDDTQPSENPAPESGETHSTDAATAIWTVQRSHSTAGDAASLPGSPRVVRAFNRWNSVQPGATIGDVEWPSSAPSGPAVAPISIATYRDATHATGQKDSKSAGNNGLGMVPVAASARQAAYVAGTFDTKGPELLFLRQQLERQGLRVVTVDLSTSGKTSTASVSAREVARHHPQGESAVFSGDRGAAVAAMALAFERFIASRGDLGGLMSAGGSGGTTLATQGMRALAVGVPKVMVSTMASGDTRPYVGPSDICMMYSVTDVQGINRISERVLANAAHALGGMMAQARTAGSAPGASAAPTKDAIGLTMFGVTTTCVQAVTQRLRERYDCLVFHATGVGGQSMEKLAGSGLLAGVIDVTTTEIADEIVGGVLSAGPHRLDVFAARALPYVGSCGALDMVNFGGIESVPERFRARRLVRHNPTVTLMRTTAEECEGIGRFIAGKLNAMAGPVRFLIPERGVSAIDAEGAAFADPAADRVLFDTIEKNFRTTTQHRLLRLPLHINDEAFAQALVDAWNDIAANPSAMASTPISARAR